MLYLLDKSQFIWRDFWIHETGTGQKVAQLHDDDDDDDDINYIFINIYCSFARFPAFAAV